MHQKGALQFLASGYPDSSVILHELGVGQPEKKLLERSKLCDLQIVSKIGSLIGDLVSVIDS